MFRFADKIQSLPITHAAISIVLLFVLSLFMFHWQCISLRFNNKPADFYSNKKTYHRLHSENDTGVLASLERQGYLGRINVESLEEECGMILGCSNA